MKANKQKMQTNITVTMDTFLRVINKNATRNDSKLWKGSVRYEKLGKCINLNLHMRNANGRLYATARICFLVSSERGW
jgi:hypothetical protein